MPKFGGGRSKNNRGDSKVEGNNKKKGEGGVWGKVATNHGIKWRMPERGDVRMGSDPLESMHCYEEITDEQFSRLQRSVFKVHLMSCVAKN